MREEGEDIPAHPPPTQACVLGVRVASVNVAGRVPSVFPFVHDRRAAAAAAAAAAAVVVFWPVRRSLLLLLLLLLLLSGVPCSRRAVCLALFPAARAARAVLLRDVIVEPPLGKNAC